MSINSLSSAKLIILILIVTLASWRPVLSAESSFKTEAVNRALAQAESKVESEKKAETQTSDDAAYRQKLEARITAEKEEELPSELDALIRFMPSRGTKSQSGKVGLIASEFEYSYALKAFGKLPVEFGIGSQYIGIENTTQVKLPSHLTSVSVGGNVTFPFFKLDKAYLRLEVMPSFYTDNWNFNSTAFRIPINTFAIYQPNEELTFMLGVHVFPGSVKDKVAPIAGLIYKPSDKLLFNLVPPKPNILYMMDKKFGLFGEFSYVSEEFLVTKDGLKNAVLLYEEKRLGAGILYKFNKFAQTSLSVGSIFNSYLKYKESLGKVVIKDGLYTEFRTELYW